MRLCAPSAAGAYYSKTIYYSSAGARAHWDCGRGSESDSLRKRGLNSDDIIDVDSSYRRRAIIVRVCESPSPLGRRAICGRARARAPRLGFIVSARAASDSARSECKRGQLARQEADRCEINEPTRARALCQLAVAAIHFV